MSVVSNWIASVHDPDYLVEGDGEALVEKFRLRLEKYHLHVWPLSITKAWDDSERGPKNLEHDMWVFAGNYCGEERVLDALHGKEEWDSEKQIYVEHEPDYELAHLQLLLHDDCDENNGLRIVWQLPIGDRFKQIGMTDDFVAGYRLWLEQSLAERKAEYERKDRLREIANRPLVQHLRRRGRVW